jgi:hypothetical protein
MIAVRELQRLPRRFEDRTTLAFLPTDQTAETLKACIELRKQLIEDVYQIIGISDIMRGATDPQETEGAQAKAQYGGTESRTGRRKVLGSVEILRALLGKSLRILLARDSNGNDQYAAAYEAQQMIAKLAGRAASWLEPYATAAAAANGWRAECPRQPQAA